MHLNVNQLSIQFLFFERPYLNYEFQSEKHYWYNYFNFPELDIGEKCFFDKYQPRLCAAKGYVHMFPCFYKHCILFDMNKYPKVYFESSVLPVAFVLRKIMVFIEGLGIGYYFLFKNKYYQSNYAVGVRELGGMMIILVILNKLSARIYLFME